MENYKAAEIYYGKKHGKDIKKPWYVYFSYRNPATEKFKVFQEKRGINRFETLKDRTAEACKLRDAINLDLKDGFNPFVTIQAAVKLSNTKTFAEAMEYALERKRKTKAHKTFIDYRSMLKYITQVSVKLGLANLDIQDIKRRQIKGIMYELQDELKLKPHRYNAYLVTIKAMFTVLLDDEIIEMSPAHGIKSEAEPEPEGFATMSDEKVKIKELIYADSFQFGLFCETIYESGIRPNEILGLQWNKIDYKNLEIKILPSVIIENRIEKVSKNLKMREVPVKESLLEKYKLVYDLSCKALELEKLPEEWFIFSNKDSLISGPGRLHRQRITERWSRVVHAEGSGIDKSKKLYGLKHTGTDDKIMADIPLEALKDQYGHYSEKMTRRYAKKLKGKNADILRRDTPDF